MRSKLHLGASNRQSNVAPNRAVSNALAALGLFLIGTLLPTACVETAECDASVPCEDSEVCYDFVCRPQCAIEADCGVASACAPCLQDDAEGAIDHCFEANNFACVPEV